MAKVITVSRTFPAYHPKAGQPTYFVEQILNALGIDWNNNLDYQKLLYQLNPRLTDHELITFWHKLRYEAVYDSYQLEKEKLHTIRAGHRWKQGDKASIRVWSGKPYNSPQIIIAPEVELVSVGEFAIRNGYVLLHNAKIANQVLFDRAEIIHRIANNDGLSMEDLKAWFKYPKPFEGQILAWKPVNYL